MLSDNCLQDRGIIHGGITVGDFDMTGASSDGADIVNRLAVPIAFMLMVMARRGVRAFGGIADCRFGDHALWSRPDRSRGDLDGAGDVYTSSTSSMPAMKARWHPTGSSQLMEMRLENVL